MLRLAMVTAVVPLYLAIVSCSGCGKASSGGLLADNGIVSPSQVQYIIYQGSTWTTPQPQLFPLTRPYRITDRTAIQAFYDAINHPAGGLRPKTAPNARVGFVAQDGRVIIFAVGGSERGCESCDANLAPAFRLAFGSPNQRQFDTTSIPAGTLVQLSYHSSSGVITLSPGATLAKAQKFWLQLLKTYNPLSLRGNVRCTRQELRRFLAWVPEYIEARVKKPVTYEAIVVPPDLDPKWPPRRGDSRSRLEKLEYDTVYVARLPKTRKQFVRFVFASKKGDCLATDAVDPRAVAGYSGRLGQPVYGPDLFNEVASRIRTPQ